MLKHPENAVKVIVTTRFVPQPEDLALVRPERQMTLNMDEGLKSPYAKNILREMDADGKVGLKSAPEELLEEAYQRTRGVPRALEVIFAILSADRNTTLREILDNTEELLPENVVEVLVGEAFTRLDSVAQLVMQALAIYAYPVTPAAVDYLLLPYHTGGVDSAPVLGRLVNMQFARRETGQRYYLHPVDRAYALSRVPEAEKADQHEMDAPPFTQIALLNRAADYLAQTRRPRESWNTIEDLAPQLQEFEVRYAGRDYETAASVLLEIDFDYLYLWGHYRLMTEMHERLRGKVSDPYLQQSSLGNLGIAYDSLGRYQEAIAYYEQALEIARKIDDRAFEGTWLGNLGNSYSSLGRYQEAIAYYEQALEIAREVEDRAGESLWLGSLGVSYNNRGRTQEALVSYEQALAIAREIGDRGNEIVLLSKIGELYLDMGQFTHAKECLEQSLDTARQIGDRPTEAFNLVDLGLLFIQQHEWREAEEHLKYAIRIADEIEVQQAQREARMYLARGYLYADDLSSAYTAIDAARRYESQGYNYELLALAGVIALRTGDSSAAQEAFQAAVVQAEAQLSYSDQVYRALDTKGLALCGLALTTGDRDFILPATDAYRKARELTKDSGIVAEVLTSLDMLKPAESEGMLADVREVAAGTDIGPI